MKDFITAPLCPPHRTDISRVKFTMPAHACDCHAHIFAPQSEFSCIENRSYTPAPASLKSYQHVLKKLGFTRAVIVQPSVYGTDNTVTLNAVQQAGHTLRAVVVVNEDISIAELHKMHAQGARGIRVNLLFESNFKIDNLKRLAHKIADLNWHIQVLIDVQDFENVYATMNALPVATVFDHMGHMSTKYGINTKGFQAMLRLLEQGKSWAKVSGAYRFTAEITPPYTDVTAVAQALVKANPNNIVYGTDWPHPHFHIPMPEDGALLNMLADWVPDTSTRNKILVNNPQRLYNF